MATVAVKLAAACGLVAARRDAADPAEFAYHLAYGPAGTTPAELVRVCDARWPIAEGFAQATGEVGLDQYAVRRWAGRHCFVTLCLLAHAYLVVLRRRAQTVHATIVAEADEPNLLLLTVPKIRRLVRALVGGAAQRAFRLGSPRGRGQKPPPATPAPPPSAVPGAALTDAAWAPVQPLRPPQRPATGQLRHDHRSVLSGIVRVIRRHASWRVVPKEYAMWEMVYKRYQLWRAEGRCQRIAAALGITEPEVSL